MKVGFHTVSSTRIDRDWGDPKVEGASFMKNTIVWPTQGVEFSLIK